MPSWRGTKLTVTPGGPFERSSMRSNAGSPESILAAGKCHKPVINRQQIRNRSQWCAPWFAARSREHWSVRDMPKKQRPDLIQLEARIAIVRRVVANQQARIAALLAAGDSAIDAERILQMYLSSLRHLEDHGRKSRRRYGRRPKK